MGKAGPGSRMILKKGIAPLATTTSEPPNGTIGSNASGRRVKTSLKLLDVTAGNETVACALLRMSIIATWR